MKLLREHHLVRQKKNFWKYTQNGLGYNFRMSGLNASLGRSQLTKIDKFIKKRNIIASHYIKKLKDLPIIFQINSPNNISSYHLFIIQITNSNNKKINQSNLFYFLKKNNVICALHYPRIDKQPFYKYSYNKNLINADFYEKSSISLPIYYDLKKNHQDKIINLILSFFNKIS